MHFVFFWWCFLSLPRLCSASLRAFARSARLYSPPMWQTAGNTVCSKRKHFNRPRSISLLSLSLRGCQVKTRARLPIVSTAQSWVYPSFSSSSYCRIGWRPTASPPVWLVPRTTWLVSTTTSLHSGRERPRSIGACLWEDGIALFPSSFGGWPTQQDRSSWLSAPPGFSLGGPGNPRADCAGTFQVVAALFDFLRFLLFG